MITRVSALVATAPIFSANSVPVRIKAGFVGMLTLIVMVRFGPPPHINDMSSMGFVVGLFNEAVAGAVMGLAVAVLFASLSLADPTTFQQVGVLGQVLNLLGMMLFLAYDGHLMMLRALFDSFALLPLGGLTPNAPAIIMELLHQGSRMFEIGLRIGIPVVGVVLLVNVGLATITRTVPQVNIFVVGFIITISVGLLIFGLPIPATAVLFRTVVDEGMASAMRLVRLM